MAMSVHDHHRRLDDLERAFEGLVGALTTLRPELRAPIGEAVRRLRAERAVGAAELLEGRRTEAAYRR